MARIFVLIILLVHSALASVLLNENLYERENRVDLMLSFDTPFQGSIRKRTEGDGTITIFLSNTEVGKPFYKSLRDSFVDSIAITKSDAQSALIKIVPKNRSIDVQASKTVDGFGLRLRISPRAEPARPLHPIQTSAAPPSLSKAEKAQKPTSAQKPLNMLKTESEWPGWRYWAVMGILLVLLLILWIVKKRGGKEATGAGWLMPGKERKESLPPEALIRFQKPLDSKNRLLLIEFGPKQYLMVVGNTNLLLDTFMEGKIEEEEEFARMFETNKKQLDHFLKEKHPDAYEIFKANASKEEHPYPPKG